jgi:hypothetical protein
MENILSKDLSLAEKVYLLEDCISSGGMDSADLDVAVFRRVADSGYIWCTLTRSHRNLAGKETLREPAMQSEKRRVVIYVEDIPCLCRAGKFDYR